MGALLGLGGLHLVLGRSSLPSGLLQGLGRLGQSVLHAGQLGIQPLQLVGPAEDARAEREAEPPVMEPPGLSTCPSRVTMRKR